MKAGYPLTVHTRKREVIEEFVSLGAVGASSPREVAEQSDMIITMLPDSPRVKEVVLGTNGVIEGAKKGSILVDMSSIAPLVMDRKFDPGFRIRLHIKDLANVLDTSHEVGVPLLLTSSVMEMMQALKVDGMGDSDHGALIRYYEKLAKTEVSRGQAT